MHRICAWCGKSLDLKLPDPLLDHPITHGICSSCAFLLLYDEQNLRVFIDSLTEPTILVDKDLVTLYCNRPALILLGKTQESIQNKYFGDLFGCIPIESLEKSSTPQYCESCGIHKSIMDTANTGIGIMNQETCCVRRSSDGIQRYWIDYSTEKKGDFVLFQIHRMDLNPESSLDLNSQSNSTSLSR